MISQSLVAICSTLPPTHFLMSNPNKSLESTHARLRKSSGTLGTPAIAKQTQFNLNQYLCLASKSD